MRKNHNFKYCLEFFEHGMKCKLIFKLVFFMFPFDLHDFFFIFTEHIRLLDYL